MQSQKGCFCGRTPILHRNGEASQPVPYPDIVEVRLEPPDGKGTFTAGAGPR